MPVQYHVQTVAAVFLLTLNILCCLHIDTASIVINSYHSYSFLHFKKRLFLALESSKSQLMNSIPLTDTVQHTSQIYVLLSHKAIPALLYAHCRPSSPPTAYAAGNNQLNASFHSSLYTLFICHTTTATSENVSPSSLFEIYALIPSNENKLQIMSVSSYK